MMAQQQGRQNVLDNYVTVAERIAAFYHTYPTGASTHRSSNTTTESGFILMRAEIYRSTDDAQPLRHGRTPSRCARESYVNKTSYIENARDQLRRAARSRCSASRSGAASPAARR